MIDREQRDKMDHLVFAVPDLASSIEMFRERLGVTPVFGGCHELVGTHNAILPVRGGSYIELIAPDPANPSPPLGLPFGMDALEEPHLVTWAVRTLDIDVAVERARNAGYDPGGVIDLTRETSEGDCLSWRLTVRGEMSADGLVPFLIDWGSTPHPSGTGESECSIEDFRAEHPDPESVRAMLRALDVSLDVESGLGPRLIANVVGPDGSIELF
jgi:catechol 2,3-dioxygenase-like lactoylglutathione lyase family enzyme